MFYLFHLIILLIISLFIFIFSFFRNVSYYFYNKGWQIDEILNIEKDYTLKSSNDKIYENDFYLRKYLL